MIRNYLITCVKAWSNPRRLLPIWRKKLRGHYHVTMTSDNDFCVWRWHYRKCHLRVSINAQTIVHNAPRIRALITSRNDRHVWTDRNSFTGMSTEMIKNAVFFVLLSKNTHKTHKIVKVAVINDNNNFAPSLFRSLCEIGGDSFGPRYFSSGAALHQKNTLGPKQSPPISHNDLKKDGAQLLLSKYDKSLMIYSF